MSAADTRIRQGAEDFLAVLKAEGTVPTPAETELFLLGHYTGATTVLGILEDLLLSAEPASDKVGQVQALIAEAQEFAAGRLAALGQLRQAEASLAALSSVPRQSHDGQG